MQPIHELLSRIRWDDDFGQGEFEVAFEDHAQEDLVVVRLDRETLDSLDGFSFEAFDAEGEPIRVPFHRVRSVTKEGRVIWERSG